MNKNIIQRTFDIQDALYHAGVFPEEMTAQIKAVKDLYPKPVEGGVE